MKLPWGRIIFGFFAVGFLIAAVYFWHGSCDWQSKVDAAIRAEPVRMAVDFSKPGEYCGELEQTFTCSHGQCIWLKTVPQFHSEEEARQALGGFTGHLAIMRTDGTIEWEKDLTSESIQVRQFWSFAKQQKSDTAVYEPMISTDIPPTGTYKICVRVDQGAPGLDGIKQTLVGQYLLCGCEFIPAELSKYVAIGSSIIGGFILLCIVVVTWRRCHARASY